MPASNIKSSCPCPICSGLEFENYHFKEGFAFLKCRKCKFIFVDVSKENLAAYYDNPNYLHDKIGKGYVDYEADKAPMASVYTNLLGKIKSYLSGRRLLDLGTASGYFLDVANRNGFVAEGIDLNPAAVKEGTARGRKIKQADFLNSGYPQESFDAITAFDFFEHLPSDKLTEYLAIMKNLLSEKGILAVITVNTASWWAKIFGRKWHTFLPPEHISYFSDRNIRLLLENNGFEVLEVKTVHKRFSLQYIFNFLYRWQGIAFWLSLARFLEKNPRLGQLALKLYLGDNMLVLARKKS